MSFQKDEIMPFDTTLKDLNTYLEQDAKDIIKLLNTYKTSRIATKTGISLNAYDCVVSFTGDPVKNTKANKDLTAKRGNYIFVITSSYTRQKDFNNVYSGAPLKNTSISVFNKDDILYVGTAKSLLSRMHQHFKKDDKYDHIGSLKLSSEEKKIIGSFFVYAFCIKDKYKDYYSIIGPKVEKNLHENLDSLVGNN